MPLTTETPPSKSKLERLSTDLTGLMKAITMVYPVYKEALSLREPKPGKYSLKLFAFDGGCSINIESGGLEPINFILIYSTGRDMEYYQLNSSLDNNPLKFVLAGLTLFQAVIDVIDYLNQLGISTNTRDTFITIIPHLRTMLYWAFGAIEVGTQNDPDVREIYRGTHHKLIQVLFTLEDSVYDSPLGPHLFPAEVKPDPSQSRPDLLNLSAGGPDQLRESIIREISLVRSGGGRDYYIFKRPYNKEEIDHRKTFGLFLGRKTRPSINSQEAADAARGVMQAYRTALIAFQGRVAKTHITLGHPTDSQGEPIKPLVEAHIYQEPVIRLRDLVEPHVLTKGEVLAMKGKDLDNLLSEGNNSRIQELAKFLNRHKEGLIKLRFTYVISVLLGYVPDIQFFSRKHYESIDGQEHNIDVGILFNDNIGLNSRDEFVLFDFGFPRLDLLTDNARLRLINLIVNHANMDPPQLPIVILTETKTLYDGSISKFPPRVILAPWYQRALKRELMKHINPQPKYYPRSPAWTQTYIRDCLEPVISTIVQSTDSPGPAQPPTDHWGEEWGSRQLAYDIQVLSTMIGDPDGQNLAMTAEGEYQEYNKYDIDISFNDQTIRTPQSFVNYLKSLSWLL